MEIFFLMYKFEFSLLYTHIDFHRTETDLLFLSGCVNGASVRNGPFFTFSLG